MSVWVQHPVARASDGMWAKETTNCTLYIRLLICRWNATNYLTTDIKLHMWRVATQNHPIFMLSPISRTWCYLLTDKAPFSPIMFLTRFWNRINLFIVCTLHICPLYSLPLCTRLDPQAPMIGVLARAGARHLLHTYVQSITTPGYVCTRSDVLRLVCRYICTEPTVLPSHVHTKVYLLLHNYMYVQWIFLTAHMFIYNTHTESYDL